MKIIFLDIDGVMVTGEYLNELVRVDGHNFHRFAKSPVFQLNKILRETGADIVISSSWRCDGPRWEALLDHFKLQGVEKRPIGRTPKLEKRLPSGVWLSAQRGYEIKTWLGYGGDVESFVAIDDDSDMDDIKDNFVLVKNGMWRGGMGESHSAKAIEILMRTK